MEHFELTLYIVQDGLKPPWWPYREVEHWGVKYQKAHLEDFIMYIEEETTLMIDPLFSWEALSELIAVKERPAK